MLKLALGVALLIGTANAGPSVFSSTAEDAINAFVNEEVSFDVSITYQSDCLPVFFTAGEDPGLPNGAELTIETLETSANIHFSWTPSHEQLMLQAYDDHDEFGITWVADVVCDNSNYDYHATHDQSIYLWRPDIHIEFGENGDEEEFIARVGCHTSISVTVGDNLYLGQAWTTDERAFHYPIEINPSDPRALPYGAEFHYDATFPDGDFLDQYPTSTQGPQAYVFDWVPVRGQEGFDYEVCFTANDWFYGYAPHNGNDYSLQRVTKCFMISVVRCEYCVQPDDTFASIAEYYDTDYLQLWSANHWLTKNPDHINDYQPIYLGPIYSVREGDSLTKIANKFHLDSVYRIVAANPDLNVEDWFDGEINGHARGEDPLGPDDAHHADHDEPEMDMDTPRSLTLETVNYRRSLLDAGCHDEGDHQHGPKRSLLHSDDPEPECEEDEEMTWDSDRRLHNLVEGQKLCIIPPICTYDTDAGNEHFIHGGDAGTLDQANEDRGSWKNQFPDILPLRNDNGWTPTADVDDDMHLMKYPGNRDVDSDWHGNSDWMWGSFLQDPTAWQQGGGDYDQNPGEGEGHVESVFMMDMVE